MSVGLIAQQLHWVDRKTMTEPLRCVVKTRYRQADIPCTITPLVMIALKLHLTTQSRLSLRSIRRILYR